MAVLLVSMNGGLFTLPRSGFVQQGKSPDALRLSLFLLKQKPAKNSANLRASV
jgi:hypothetical protein